MTQEDKELLIDLCARLPYRPKGVKLYGLFDPKDITIIGYTGRFVETVDDEIEVGRVRLYLRPMSSMIKEEKDTYDAMVMCNASWVVDNWLNAHYLDYRDLIGKGLALPAPKGMYV